MENVQDLSSSKDNNLETFSLVWLDATVNESKENREVQQQLRKSINRLKTFNNADECEQYIRSMSEQDRVVIIVSGRLGQEVVPRIHHLRQVCRIYVYCMDRARNERWAKQFSKVRIYPPA
jgi:hypothetical protein